jgi:hypothetical protein
MDDTVCPDSRRRCLNIRAAASFTGAVGRVHHVDRFKRGSERLSLLHPHLYTSVNESQRC